MKNYGLPEDMAVKLQTEPEQVLPYLAARVHQNVVQQVVGRVTELLTTQLPTMIRNHQAISEAELTAKNTFYGRWPQLKVHEETVKKAGVMFRSLNPNADSQTALEAIGKLVCDSLGIPQGTGGAPAAPAAPASPAAPAFRPAGGSPGGGNAPQGDNVYTSLAEEMIADGD